ncbi:MAG: hypothetical protein RLZZ488_1474 [Pseudomonadota bacterium]
MTSTAVIIHPDLDLVYIPTTRLSVEQIWRGWTDQEFLPKWFCPRPWKVTECRIDLKPGGEFYTRMQGPNGEVVDNHGCILEVIPFKRLVTTNLLHKGLRPVKIEEPDFPNVIEIDLNNTGVGPKYRAVIRHLSNEHKLRHEAMGFPQGWDIAHHQLQEQFGI